jgi:hypothetical protein
MGGSERAAKLAKDRATEFPRIRILIVSRQSERIYAARACTLGSRLLDEKRFGRRIIGALLKPWQAGKFMLAHSSRP